MGARGGEGGGGSGEGKLASDLEERDRGDLVDVKTWKPDARPPLALSALEIEERKKK